MVQRAKLEKRSASSTTRVEGVVAPKARGA